MHNLYKISLFDVSYKMLVKHGRTPYETYSTGVQKNALKGASECSEETGLCVSVQNIDTGERFYFEDGVMVASS